MAQAIFCPACQVFYTAELRGKSCPACGEELIHARFPANFSKKMQIASMPTKPKRLPSSGRAAWDHIVKKDICAFCQNEISTTIDHIRPKALGGSKGHWTNRIGACFECNNTKKHTPLLFFMLQQEGVDISPHLTMDGDWPIPAIEDIIPEIVDDATVRKKEAQPNQSPQAFIYEQAYANRNHKKVRNRDPDHEGGCGRQGEFCSRRCESVSHCN